MYLFFRNNYNNPFYITLIFFSSSTLTTLSTALNFIEKPTDAKTYCFQLADNIHLCFEVSRLTDPCFLSLTFLFCKIIKERSVKIKMIVQTVLYRPET